MGTFLYQTSDPYDARPLLAGEVRVYTGLYQFTTVSYGIGVWGQWVINWSPSSGMVREVFYYVTQGIDPSNVYWYQYPTQASQTTAALLLDIHITLSPGSNPFSGSPLNIQGGDVSISLFGGQYTPVQTPLESSFVAYGSSNGNPILQGSGQTVTPNMKPFSAGLADNAAFAELTRAPSPESPAPLPGLASLLPLGLPMGSGTIADASAKPNTELPDTSSSGVPYTTETGPLVPGYGQDNQSLAALYPQGSASPGSEDVPVVQTGSISGTQGSGSAWPLGVLAGLVLVIGALGVARRLTPDYQSETGQPVFGPVVLPGKLVRPPEPVTTLSGDVYPFMNTTSAPLEPDLVTVGGVESTDAASLFSTLDPVNLYHLEVPGTDVPGPPELGSI